MTDSKEDGQGGLLSRSFLGLLLTQLLGAMNDNMFRWLVVPIGKELLADPARDGAGAALALSIGLACFVLPYLLFAAVAGYLADRFSKRTVIVCCKAAEVVLMSAGAAAIWLNNVYLMFFVLFCMGTQSALFGPSKLGSLPEMLRPEKLSVANGMIGLTTILATVAGTAAGNVLYELTKESAAQRAAFSAAALLGVAAAGLAASLAIRKLPPANPARPIPKRLLRETLNDLRFLAGHSGLFRVALGIAFFWMVASLAQLNVDGMIVEQFGRAQTDVAAALAVLAVGVGLGSVLAGFLSGGKVELGLVPLGAAGVVVFSILLNAVSQGYIAWLLLLGASGGMFNVPLAAYMQHRSPAESRGRILAAGNFLAFAGMLCVSGVFYILHGALKLEATAIFLITGIATVPVLLYAVTLLPWATARLAVWLAAHTVYRVRVEGREHLPDHGGALLVANHVTWLDGLLLMMSSSRPLRLLVESDRLKSRVLRRAGRLAGVIEFTPPLEHDSRASSEAAAALRDGQIVCIFAEGEITRTGRLQEFRHDVIGIARQAGVPIVPVYLDELWGSIFSYERGRLLWKLPRRWPYRVTIRFGPPIAEAAGMHQIREAVELLSGASGAGPRQ
ncbi:MAG: MFS transporter [Pirellulales bacterium]